MKHKPALTIIIGFVAGVVLGGAFGDLLHFAGAQLQKMRISVSLGQADRLLAKGMPGDALAVLERIRLTPPVKKNPLLYGRIKSSEGLACFSLAASSDTKTYAPRAVAAFREAAAVYSPLNRPLAYADVQNNLGSAYTLLAGIKDRQENAALAAAAYDEALKIFTPGEFPDRRDAVLKNKARLVHRQKTHGWCPGIQ